MALFVRQVYTAHIPPNERQVEAGSTKRADLSSTPWNRKSCYSGPSISTCRKLHRFLSRPALNPTKSPTDFPTRRALKRRG